MRVTLRELWRRPGRFAPVTGAMTLLVVLLAVLGGFLDGLALTQTGALRAQGDRLWVTAEAADLQLSRSRLSESTRAAVADVDGVAAVGGFATFDATASSGDGEPVDVVVVGYEQATDVVPEPPAEGEAVADARLQAFLDVEAGDSVALGQVGAELRVAAFVDDLTQGAPTLWVPLDAWRELAAEVAPTAVPGDSAAQALVVTPVEAADPDDLAAAIEASAADVTVVGLDELLDGQPVVAQQTATFQGIIGVTFVVVLLVVALFFALLMLERARLYALLKAVGARDRDLAGGVIAQAVLISVFAFVVGVAISAALVAVLPADLPVRLIPTRLALIAVGTLATAVAGVLLVLRRLVRVEPASAIG